jgi:hypothetical protein
MPRRSHTWKWMDAAAGAQRTQAQASTHIHRSHGPPRAPYTCRDAATGAHAHTQEPRASSRSPHMQRYSHGRSRTCTGATGLRALPTHAEMQPRAPCGRRRPRRPQRCSHGRPRDTRPGAHRRPGGAPTALQMMGWSHSLSPPPGGGCRPPPEGVAACRLPTRPPLPRQWLRTRSNRRTRPPVAPPATSRAGSSPQRLPFPLHGGLPLSFSSLVHAHARSMDAPLSPSGPALRLPLRLGGLGDPAAIPSRTLVSGHFAASQACTGISHRLTTTKNSAISAAAAGYSQVGPSTTWHPHGTAPPPPLPHPATRS